jgi:hypothetical protein
MQVRSTLRSGSLALALMLGSAAGTTRGLVETLDQLTGGNWQPWFERYVYGTEVPQLPR